MSGIPFNYGTLFSFKTWKYLAEKRHGMKFGMPYTVKKSSERRYSYSDEKKGWCVYVCGEVWISYGKDKKAALDDVRSYNFRHIKCAYFSEVPGKPVLL